MVEAESSVSSVSHKGKSVDLKLSNDFAFFGRKLFRAGGGEVPSDEPIGMTKCWNVSSDAEREALCVGDWR
jgi:hypothetical protein